MRFLAVITAVMLSLLGLVSGEAKPFFIFGGRRNYGGYGGYHSHSSSHSHSHEGYGYGYGYGYNRPVYNYGYNRPWYGK